MADAWVREGDTGPFLRKTLTDDETNDNVDLTAATVTLSLRRIHTNEVILEAVPADLVGDPTAGTVEYVWTTDVPEPGGYEGFFRVTYADDTIVSYPNDGWMTVAVPPNIAEESS